jgi:hypothetical protein
MNIKKIISSIGIGAGAIILGLGIQYVLADWTQAPTGTPPNCPAGYPGCDAPVNVGSSGQVKNGPLTLNFTNAVQIGLKVLGQVQIVDGHQAASNVLTSDASGIASWNNIWGSSGIGCLSKGTDFVLQGIDSSGNPKCVEVTLAGGGPTNNNYYNNYHIWYNNDTTTIGGGIIPAGVPKVGVILWGGGGGGGSRPLWGSSGEGGASGGSTSAPSPGYKEDIAVTTGQTISIVVGSGGSVMSSITYNSKADCDKHNPQAGGSGGLSKVTINTTPVTTVGSSGGGPGESVCDSTVMGTGQAAGSYGSYTGGAIGQPPGGGGNAGSPGGAGEVIIEWHQ